MPGYNVISVLDYFIDMIPKNQLFAVVLDVYVNAGKEMTQRGCGQNTGLFTPLIQCSVCI